MKKVVVLTGAGISAESGIKTFRDSNGLWEGHDVMEVASPEGWAKNPELVLDFYNQRRKNVRQSKPNAGHLALVDLEAKYDVHIITQNVDDLHERAGSRNVMHLHGEILQAKSSQHEELVYDLEEDIHWGDKCERGSQLRPNIVWFGEMVPAFEEAAMIARNADIFMIIGTSMIVYPAAGLIHYVEKNIPVYLVDPNTDISEVDRSVFHFKENATTGVPRVVQQLLQ